MIITRYFSKSIVATLIGVTAVLLVVFLSNRFARYLADAVTGEVSGQAILVLLALKVPSYLVMVLPLGLFLAILLVFGRLHRDNEMTVMAACGIGPARLVATVLYVAGPVTLVVATLALLASPWSMDREYKVRAHEAAVAQLRNITPGRFNEIEGGRGIFYVERVAADGDSLQKIFVARNVKDTTGEQATLGVLSSAAATQYLDERTGDRFISLHDGYRYQGVPGQADFEIVHYGRYSVRIQEKAEPPKRYKRNSRGSGTLWQSEDPLDRAEIQWRISLCLSVPVLVLLAVPMSRADPRQGRFARVLPGVLTYVIYMNLLGLARVWVEQERVPDWLGMWWVHLLFLGVALLMLPGHFGWRQLRLRLRRLSGLRP